MTGMSTTPCFVCGKMLPSGENLQRVQPLGDGRVETWLLHFGCESGAKFTPGTGQIVTIPPPLRGESA
jgi:hypothetical protein